jgi:adenine-specific DNA-methyltransferase
MGREVELEQERLRLQSDIDTSKTAAERNKLGQFATPPSLADDIVHFSKRLMLSSADIRFLDPAVGSGSFFSALLRSMDAPSIRESVGYEIDPAFADVAESVWASTGLDVRRGDFTRAIPPPTGAGFDLIICNPPYVRHHHLSVQEKHRIREQSEAASGISLSGLSGLYAYFLSLSHAWMNEGALAAWLIPQEFLDVNYGEGIRQYLTQRVTLLRIHCFDPKDVQFADALVSSAVVWFRKSAPDETSEAEFTSGGSLKAPRRHETIRQQDIDPSAKWRHSQFRGRSTPRGSESPIFGDYFEIKRGIATGANDFFVISVDRAAELKLPSEFLRPILPGPRTLADDIIRADEYGNPLTTPNLLLVNCNLAQAVVEDRYSTLWNYLQTGQQNGISERYLCRHRSPWYSQEHRETPLFLCTYMNRIRNGGGAFRFLLNTSSAIATNVYLLLYPKAPLSDIIAAHPECRETVWQALQRIAPDDLLREGRVYGGGLYKLEPGELRAVPANGIADIVAEYRESKLLTYQIDLLA